MFVCVCVLYVCGGFGGLLHGTTEDGMAAFHPRNPKQRFPLKHCQGTGQGHTCCLAPNIRLASTFTAAPKLPGFKPQYTEPEFPGRVHLAELELNHLVAKLHKPKYSLTRMRDRIETTGGHEPAWGSNILH